MPVARKVGLFVFFTLVLIAAMILNFSKGRGLFTSTYNVRILSDGVGGLKVGAPVTLAGVQVGNVSRIDLTEDRRAVEIKVQVLQKYPIRKDSKFEIEQSGFLGDQFVAIHPQSDTAAYLVHDDKVQAEKPFDLTETARSLKGQLGTGTNLLGKLDIALVQINGLVERVDRQLVTDATLTNLAATAVNFRRASEEAAGAIVDVRRLITNNSPAVAATLSNLNALSVSLNGTATNLDAFVTEQRPVLREAVANAGVATADLKAITTELREGRGVAGALLSDESLRLQVGGAFTNLATVSSNLARFGLLYKPPQPKKTLTNQVKYTGKDPWASTR